MEFVSIPTEQTTAITDGLMGVLGVVLLSYLHQFSAINRSRVRLWQGILGLFAIGGFLGAFRHGIVMAESSRQLLRHPMYLAIGVMVALFVAAAINDAFGFRRTKQVLPVLMIVALGFFLLKLQGGSFLLFIVYETVAMIFALGIYVYLTWQRSLSGAGLIALGIVLNILAAAVQTYDALVIHLVFTFDHNGIFHIIAMIATFIGIIGVSKGFEA